MSSRRAFIHRASALGLLLLAAHQRALAVSLSQLSNADAASGVKAALARGAEVAVDLLGRTDGFLGNPQVRIGLPGQLEDAAKLMRRFGQRSDRRPGRPQEYRKQLVIPRKPPQRPKGQGLRRLTLHVRPCTSNGSRKVFPIP